MFVSTILTIYLFISLTLYKTITFDTNVEKNLLLNPTLLISIITYFYISYMRQEPLTLREHLDFTLGLVISILFIIFVSLLCICSLFAFVLCLVCPLMVVSLECPFLIVLSVFAYVFCFINEY